MKKILIYPISLIILILYTVTFTSCTKEVIEENYDEEALNLRADEMSLDDYTYSFVDIDNISDDVFNYEATSKLSYDKCFHINYPFSIQFPDSTIVTVSSNFELFVELLKWKINNPKVKGKVQLVYPVDITYNDGTIYTVKSKDEMIDLIRACVDQIRNLKLGSSVKLIYPVTLVYPDGSTELVDSKEQLKELLVEWRDSNISIQGHPHIQFPFEVQLRNGDVLKINNLQELRSAIKMCIKNHWMEQF